MERPYLVETAPSCAYPAPMGEKPVVLDVLAKKATLCYKRIRCPCCGMWTRLDNVTRDHILYEESTCYSTGDRGLFHTKIINELNLKPFWLMRLKYVLKRMGYEEKPKSYAIADIPTPYVVPASYGAYASYHGSEVKYRVETEVNSRYE